MEENKRNKKIVKVIKRAKGVTMLALVVTIIVLLILAAITLSLAVGENGIIKRAKLARDKAKNASIQEEEAMNELAGEIDNAGNGGSSGGGSGEGTCPDVSELEKQIEELNKQIEELKTKQATGNAAVSEVLAGKTFSNSSGVGLAGTMANNGAINANLNAGQSHNIPAGYTTGGRVTANSLASQTVGTATANNLSNGVTAWVNGVKITGNGTDIDTAYNDGYNDGKENTKNNVYVSEPTTLKKWGSYTATEDCIFVMNGSATRGSNGSTTAPDSNTGSQTNITTNGIIKNSKNLQYKLDGGGIDFTLTAELKAGNVVNVNGRTWGYASNNNGGVSWTYIILKF